MAQQRFIGISPTTYVADVDFSGSPAGAQYRGVAAASTAGNVGLGTGGSNPAPLGVIQNSPSQGQAAEVITLGPTFLQARCATCTLNFGRFLVCASDGVFDVAAAGCPANARWDGPNVTTGSAYGAAFFFGGIATCHPTLT